MCSQENPTLCSSIKRQPKLALIVLTYQAEADLQHLLPVLKCQTLQPDVTLFIDSSSKDKTQSLLADYPGTVHVINQNEFDHGGTRKLATQIVDADIYIYLTQDAYPAEPNTFLKLIQKFNEDESIGCVYGRQLPKKNATPLSAHLRNFNYPGQSYVRELSDCKQYGIKTCFNSDSFAAYKKEALLIAGNFPEHLMTAEDMYVAAKMLLSGYKIAYAADAAVYHSHNLSLKEEFHRYFSIGTFHAREKWLIEKFSSPTNEGFKYVKSEWHYLLKQRQLHWLPRSLISIAIKLIAYKIGLKEAFIPLKLKKNLGINKSFWRKPEVESV